MTRAEGDQIVCDGVYPGIRLTVVSQRNRLRYRFDVYPGANPGAIRAQYKDVDEIRVEGGARTLVVRADDQVLVEQGLRCFQEVGTARVDVPCAYEVARGADRTTYAVSFRIAAFDRRVPLVIDPEIAWSSYLGASGIDEGRSIALDGSGNIYIAGSTSSTDFPTPGGFDTMLDWFGYDAFVTKINAAGSGLVWSSFLGGGAFDDYGYGIAVDASGNAYITGRTSSSDFPTVGGFDSVFGGGESDAFVTKVNAQGSSLAWSSFLGDAFTDWGAGIAVDGSGNAYVTGFTWGADFPTTGGFDTTAGSTQNAFVTKVHADGSSLIWSSYLGGDGGWQYGEGIAVDVWNAVYVTGRTVASDFPTMGGFDTTLGGIRDAFVTKVDASGSSLTWSSYLGGGGEDDGYGIAVDSVGNVHVTGSTQSPDFPIVGGFGTTYAGTGDAFVAKVNAGGSSLAWSSYLGGGGSDEGRGMAVDGSGNAFVTGSTESWDFPVQDAFDATYGSVSDAFVTKVAGIRSGQLTASGA